jgi:uncharacterized protein (TIGR03083 family)
LEPATDFDLQAAVSTEFLALADLLGAISEAEWDTPSLCAGWRVREVVAHMTMPVRYSPAAFMQELQDCEGDFTRLSNRVASRDAGLPTSELVGNLRDPMLHQWTPPGGGPAGALNHVVIHGLDVTVPLGDNRRAPAATVRAVLDDLTQGGTHAHFGFELDGIRLRATDIDWAFGSGRPISGTGQDLALIICGRQLPAGRIDRDQP